MAGKQALDKEAMFRKIMPSASLAGGPASPAQAEPVLPYPPEARAPAPDAEPLEHTPVDQPAASHAAPEAVNPAENVAAANAIAAAQAAADSPEPAPPASAAEASRATPGTGAIPPPRHASAARGDDSQPHPVNLAETLVNRVYPQYRQRLNGCQCARCRDDASAIALNRIKPHYVASDRLQPDALNDRELITESVTALMKALFLVKRRPRHTAEDLLGL